MYRFLMVDDEEIVRRGFRRKIDWERLGFEFLEPCENGEQALEAIRSLHPDVVMTDIYMPKVDGLAVAAYAAEHHPEIVVVILSGYDEFEYAQKAIRSKVFEYVLKPVTSRDLTGLLGRLKERLDADQRSRQDESALMERADQGADLLKARRLTALVTGAQDAMEEAEFEELFGFSPRGLSCAAVVAERDPAARAAMPGGARLSEIVAAGVGPMRRALPFSRRRPRGAPYIRARSRLLRACRGVRGRQGGRRGRLSRHRGIERGQGKLDRGPARLQGGSGCPLLSSCRGDGKGFPLSARPGG